MGWGLPLSPLKIAAHQLSREVTPFSAGVDGKFTATLEAGIKEAPTWETPNPHQEVLQSVCLCFISQMLLNFSPFYFS